MAREVATAYTGANVTINIGADIVANAFGITWELSQNKRPIYGYNSMYYDAVATGQVLVMGQLFLNYQHPNYLSRVLSNYFRSRPDTRALNADEGAELTPTVMSTRSNILARDVMRNAFINSDSEVNPINIIEQVGGKARQERNLISTLDEIFRDPSFNSGAAMTGALYNSVSSIRVGEDGHAYQVIDSAVREGPVLDLPSNLSTTGRRDPAAGYARPDLFSDNHGLYDLVNIVVSHGDPGLNKQYSGILSYVPSSSIILRGVHFIGEAQQIMSDDQPIMETYKFIARSKETLIDPSKAPNREETVTERNIRLAAAIEAQEEARKAEAAEAEKTKKDKAKQTPAPTPPAEPPPTP